MRWKRFSLRYVHLLTGLILGVIILFHYLTWFNVYQLQYPFKESYTYKGVTFKLLDHHRCGEDCSPCKPNHENLLLVSVSRVNDEAIINFLKDFRSNNHCGSFIILQKGSSINKNWERIITERKIDSITIPDNYISRAFLERGYFGQNFNTVDFSKGKPKRFRVFNPDGSLVLESVIINNNVIKHITFHWENAKLISCDTVLQSEIPK